jgi:serine/threonine protein kinase
LVEGRPLQEYCGKLNDSELQTSLVAIFDIAAFIHHIGYIYNDYKLKILSAPDGSLKLIDFNLAQKNDSQVSNKWRHP